MATTIIPKAACGQSTDMPSSGVSNAWHRHTWRGEKLSGPFAYLYSAVRALAGMRRMTGASIPSRMLQHAGDSAICGTFEPATSGPTAIVIGARAPRKALASLAQKHGLEVSALEAFARQEVAA